MEQLTYFLKLSEYKNFSLASYELCMSQSSLSKQIKALENELNTILFDRNTRNLSLTPSGEEFLMYAQKTIDEFNNIFSKLQKFDYTTTLNICAIPVTAQYGIISAISKFKSIYSNININLIEDESHSILNKSIKSESDFCIVRDFNLSNDIFDITHLSTDELVLIVSKTHALANKSKISLLDIKDEKLILLGPKSGIYERCINEFHKHSLSPNITTTSYKVETILGLVGENFGVTLLMRKVINSFNISHVSIVSLKNPICAPLSLINQKDKVLSNSGLLFKSFIKDYFNE
ncbi:LysR family transcriptional regulator [Clostridium butyricum]|uniref:LysR family transcriptional regulator n=1 Tax=Clostridium butyricum TaxID=1492 RepID=UPI0029315C24|nr:LysR family transcriptional regulator [Clostridium butyricum]